MVHRRSKFLAQPPGLVVTHADLDELRGMIASLESRCSSSELMGTHIQSEETSLKCDPSFVELARRMKRIELLLFRASDSSEMFKKLDKFICRVLWSDDPCESSPEVFTAESKIPETCPVFSLVEDDDDSLVRCAMKRVTEKGDDFKDSREPVPVNQSDDAQLDTGEPNTPRQENAKDATSSNTRCNVSNAPEIDAPGYEFSQLPSVGTWIHVQHGANACTMEDPLAMSAKVGEKQFYKLTLIEETAEAETTAVAEEVDACTMEDPLAMCAKKERKASVQGHPDGGNCRRRDPGEQGVRATTWSNNEISIWYKVTSKMAQEAFKKNRDANQAREVIDRRWQVAVAHLPVDVSAIISQGLDELKAGIEHAGHQ